tara:strand:+ start:145 stop:351 length:207 start_codon:yes stop_codon:yes gene_type:complete
VDVALLVQQFTPGTDSSATLMAASKRSLGSMSFSEKEPDPWRKHEKPKAKAQHNEREFDKPPFSASEG